MSTPTAAPDYSALTDEALTSEYAAACDLASKLYDAGEDTTLVDSCVDLLLAAMIERGIA